MSGEDTKLKVKVEQDTEGAPAYKTVTFMYKGIRAPPVRANAKATEVYIHNLVYWQTCFI